MPKVTYESGGRWATTDFGGLRFESGETKEVSDEAADYLVENYDFRQNGSAGGDGGDVDDSEAGEWLTSFNGIGEAKSDDLEDAGYARRGRVEQASVEDLAAVDGISRGIAEEIKREVGRGDGE